MFTFLLVVHIIVAAALVAVILMQRSEGGGLASSGNPAGLMSARGAADFLTLHLPLTDETRGSLGQEALGPM